MPPEKQQFDWSHHNLT